MVNRLEPINLVSFVGGLNLRRNQFELADNESPDMLNVDVDPRGGFFTRKGWQRWNAVDIVDLTTTTWEPRNIWTHTRSDGNQTTYVVNGGAAGVATGPLVLVEPFDNLTNWTSVAGGGTIIPGGRTGNGLQLVASDNTAHYRYVLPGPRASNYVTIGFAINVSSITNYVYLFSLDSDSGTTPQTTMLLTPTGQISIYKGAPVSTIIGTSGTGVVTAGAWYYIELRVYVADTGGYFEVRVNGATVLGPGVGTYSPAGDTRAAGSTPISAVTLRGANLSTVTSLWDDFYVATGSGSDAPFYGGLPGSLFRSDSTATFGTVAGVSTGAVPHGADFTAWGDDVYIAGGMFGSNYRINGAGALTTLAETTWSEVDAPVSNMMPASEFVTTHAGYTFIAVTNEADGNHFGRVRWSHPGKPDAFATDDFLDIDIGGGRITGIMSFDDHLLIFKSSTMWALYGYSLDTWQLVQVSTKIGCPTVSAMTRSETTAFFYSASDRGGIYAYQGGHVVYLSEALTPAFDETFVHENVFVSFAARKLWVSVPWLKGSGTMEEPTTTFVYDSNVGTGAWTMYRSNLGSLGLVTDNSDITSKYPLALFWSAVTACVVQLEYIDDAYDVLTDPFVLGTADSIPDNPDAPYLVTSLDEEILASGDVFVGSPFDSYYRTKWIHGGWPDRKKSWRRPTFVCRQVLRDTDLIVETFRDYDETNVHRSRTLKVRTRGGAMWTEDGFDDATTTGFDWSVGGAADASGRGADWGALVQGSTLVRAGSQGLARAIQMKVRASPTTLRQKWGVDGIVAKIVMRRFR